MLWCLWLYLRPQTSSWVFMFNRLYSLPPSQNDKVLIDHLTLKLDLALMKFPNAVIFLVGDFNRCPVSQLQRRFTLKQIIKDPTRNSAILDLILTNMAAFCDSHWLLRPLVKVITIP